MKTDFFFCYCYKQTNSNDIEVFLTCKKLFYFFDLILYFGYT